MGPSAAVGRRPSSRWDRPAPCATGAAEERSRAAPPSSAAPNRAASMALTTMPSVLRGRVCIRGASCARTLDIFRPPRDLGTPEATPIVCHRPRTLDERRPASRSAQDPCLDLPADHALALLDIRFGAAFAPGSVPLAPLVSVPEPQ